MRLWMDGKGIIKAYFVFIIKFLLASLKLSTPENQPKMFWMNDYRVGGEDKGRER